MKALKNILKFKYLYVCILGIILILSIIRINLFPKTSKYNGNENSFLVKVTSLKYQNEKYIVELDGKEKLISYCDAFPYDVGDILSIKGTLSLITKNTIPNVFNYQNYYNNKNIFYRLNINDIVLERKNSSILNKLRIKIRKRIELQNNNEYLYAFIIGNTSYLDKENFEYNGISFLLSIGSFQVLSISYVLEFIKRKLKIKEKDFLWIISLLLLGYLWLVNFKIGILRCSLCYLLKRVLKYYKRRIKYSNIILIVGSVLLLINPYFLNNTGFYYSFIISYGLSIMKKIKGNYFKKMLYLSLYATILSFPITIYTNYEVNFLSFLISAFFMPIIHFIIFPLSIISFIFPFFNGILNFFISMINDLNTFFATVNVFHFIFRKPSIIIILVYYLVMFLFLKNKKYGLIVLIMMLIHLNINKIIRENLVVFFDVSQGDSILIKNNDKVYLIDTGGGSNKSYIKDIIKYIHSLGINKLDGLICTHGDTDHCGEAINLVNNFKVEKVIFNCGPYNDLEKELIIVLEKKKIKYYSCIKKLNIDNNKFYFLQTTEYDNENDNSNVIYTELNGYKFMFMGDASITTEKEILNNYNLPDIDVLKVGHHGSKTSSGKEFIDNINPKYSIISVGKNNRYGHPNKEVLSILENSKIYRTDQDGSIMFKINNNKLKIETCSP